VILILVCAWMSQAACSDRLHYEAGVLKCSDARVGEVCYRPGGPIEVKREQR